MKNVRFETLFSCLNVLWFDWSNDNFARIEMNIVDTSPQSVNQYDKGRSFRAKRVLVEIQFGSK